MSLKVEISQAKEQLIYIFPVGTVFAANQDLLVKIDKDKCMILGDGRLIHFNHNTMAYLVRSVSATI